jgi:hypothetical protein
MGGKIKGKKGTHNMVGNASVETGLAMHLATKALEAPGPKNLKKVRAAFVASGMAHANSTPENHTAAAEAHEAAGNGKYSTMAAKVHRALAAKKGQFWRPSEEEYLSEGTPKQSRRIEVRDPQEPGQQQAQG